MAGWEIALVMVALTYMMVNVVALIVQLKMLSKMDGIIDKSLKYVEKLMDQGEKAMDELFGFDDEEKEKISKD